MFRIFFDHYFSLPKESCYINDFFQNLDYNKKSPQILEMFDIAEK